MKKQKTQSKLIVALTAVVLLLVALSATLTFAYFTASSNATSDSMTFGTLSVSTDNITLGTDDNPSLASGVTGHGDDCRIDNIVPGCTIQLGGTVGIEGSIDAFVRAQLVVTVKQTRNADGTLLTVTDGTGDYAGMKMFGDLVATETAQDSGEYYVEYTTNQTHSSNKNKADLIYDKIFAVINAGQSGANAKWISYTDGYMYYKNAVNGSATEGVKLSSNLINLTDTYIELEAVDFGNDWQGAEIEVSILVQAIQAEHLGVIAANAVLNDSSADPTDAAEIAALSGLTTIWGNANGVIGA